MSIENWPMWLKTWRKWLQRTSKSPKLPKILKVAKILKSCRKVAEQLVAKPSTQVISTDLNPESPKMSLLMLLFCRALATDFVMLNPFLAKSMAGWTSCFHGNRPCWFQASYWPRTSPGTAMDRPPKKKLRYHLPLFKRGRPGEKLISQSDRCWG